MTNVHSFDPRPAPATPERAPPASAEAEQALLGAILLNNATWHAIGARLAPEHFAEEIHRRIFEVASALIREGRVASPITMATFLGDHDLGGITVPHYLARLIAEASPPLAAPDYARHVIDLAARRRLIAIADEMREQAHDPPAALPVDKLVDAAEERLTELRTGMAASASTRVTAGDAAADLLAHVDRIRAEEDVGTGASTGIPDIDRDTGGMHAGDLWIVAGRVGMGKTIAATTLARAAARTGAGVLLFPFEIGRRQAAARLMADLSYDHRTPTGYGAILRGEIDDDARWRLDDARERLARMPLVIDDAPRLSVAGIASRVRTERDRMAKTGVRLGVAIVDYIKFVTATDRYAGQRVNEVGEISVGLKQVARDLGVCVVLIAQVNRQAEFATDKRPGLATLRESGDLESDADVVGFVYREAYYIESSPEYRRRDPDAFARALEARHKLEFIVAKNRTGATRTHHLWCDVSCSTMSAQARGWAP